MAICTGAPLVTAPEVTTAVRFPVLVGGALKATVSEVSVESVTVPIAPWLNRILLAAGDMGSNPVPLMVTVVAPTARLPVFAVTVNAAFRTPAKATKALSSAGRKSGLILAFKCLSSCNSVKQRIGEVRWWWSPFAA